jgi:hypothetical protein
MPVSALTGEGSYEHRPSEGDRVMKNTRLTSIFNSSLIACALTIGSLASTQIASAQSSTPLAQVTIPFAFQTPTQSLPAGTYNVIQESDHLLRFQGTGSTGGFVLTHTAVQTHASNRGSIVFDRYGDKYYLRQIWTAGENEGLECRKSRAEKESMQASNTQAPSSVELALNSIPKH